MAEPQQEVEGTGVDSTESGASSKLSLNRETLATCAEGGGKPEPGGGSDPKGGREEER